MNSWWGSWIRGPSKVEEFPQYTGVNDDHFQEGNDTKTAFKKD